MPVSYGPEKEDAEEKSEGILVERRKKAVVGEFERTIASDVKVFIRGGQTNAEDWRFGVYEAIIGGK